MPRGRSAARAGRRAPPARAHRVRRAEKGGVEVVKELVTKGKADLRLCDTAGCSVLQYLPSEAARQELRALQPLSE